MVRELD